MTVLVVDDYNREYTETYTFNVIEQIIPVTSFVITADGEEVGSTLTKSCGGSYTNFSAIQLGYITTPANANAITSVEYSSSASTYVSVDSNGLLNITAAGKISRSVTSVITVTITNADGSTATNSVTVTITRA
jgi:hypothetical protein